MVPVESEAEASITNKTVSEMRISYQMSYSRLKRKKYRLLPE